MKTIVDTYRGFEISFDTNTSTFTAWSDHRDTQFSKKSYNGAKLGVDEYIKENKSFSPFWVQEAKSSYGDEVRSLKEPVLITGIRKDGKPTYEKDGKKVTIGKHNISQYILYNKENDSVGKELEAIDKAFDDYRTAYNKDRIAIAKKVKQVTLKSRLIEIKEQNN